MFYDLRNTLKQILYVIINVIICLELVLQDSKCVSNKLRGTFNKILARSVFVLSLFCLFCVVKTGFLFL